MDHEFREKVITTLRTMKFEFVKRPDALTVPVYQEGRVVGRLRPIHSDFSAEDVRLLVEWRNQNREAFFTWFITTEEGTRQWLKEQVLLREDRILFFVETIDGIPFGHIGLSNFDFCSKTCEIDNVLRGRAQFVKGRMSSALQTLINWVFLNLKCRSVYLRVFSDNQRALDLYMRNGLQVVKKVPARRVEEGNVIRWIELEEESPGLCEKYILYLKKESANE